MATPPKFVRKFPEDITVVRKLTKAEKTELRDAKRLVSAKLSAAKAALQRDWGFDDADFANEFTSDLVRKLWTAVYRHRTKQPADDSPKYRGFVRRLRAKVVELADATGLSGDALWVGGPESIDWGRAVQQFGEAIQHSKVILPGLPKVALTHMPEKCVRLIEFLAQHDQRAEFEDLAGPVWGDEARYITDSTAGSLRRNANHALAGLPYRVAIASRVFRLTKKD